MPAEASVRSFSMIPFTPPSFSSSGRTFSLPTERPRVPRHRTGCLRTQPHAEARKRRRGAATGQAAQQSATILAKIQLYRAAAWHGLGYFAPCLAHQLVLEGEAAQARQRLGINVKRRHRVAEQKGQSPFRFTRSAKRESEGGSAASTPSRLACPRSQTNEPQGEGLLGGTRPRLKLIKRPHCREVKAPLLKFRGCNGI